MDEIACDVAVIGAGTAGIAAHKAAREAGAHSLLIERGPGGTTCARVGCMPSKLLITAAAAAHDAREAGRFGVHVAGLHVDGRAVMGRVRALRDDFVASVFESLSAFPEDTRIEGRAVFEDARTLRVGDHRRVRFGAAVLATGSSPSVPKPLEGLGRRVLTTDTIFEIESLPASLAVLGGGPVGLELAQSFARLGVRTVLFDPSSNLGGLRDPELCGIARQVFGREIELRLGAEVDAGEPSGEGARLRWCDRDGGTGEESFAAVLAAAGRPPNVRGIGLDRAGLRLDDRGSPAFDPRSLLCEGAPIFIAGDANADRPVLHEAARQGRIAGRNAAALARGSQIERPERWVDLAIVFSHPQIAAVGQRDDAQAAGRIVGTASFAGQGRARITARDEGGLRLYADRAGHLLGAEMLGPDVEHLAHLVAGAIGEGHTARSLRERPFYHPTVEEALDTALSDIVRTTGR